MIAMALANKPDLLIADEPTTSLDVTIEKEIVDLLMDIKSSENVDYIYYYNLRNETNFRLCLCNAKW